MKEILNRFSSESVNLSIKTLMGETKHVYTEKYELEYQDKSKLSAFQRISDQKAFNAKIRR